MFNRKKIEELEAKLSDAEDERHQFLATIQLIADGTFDAQEVLAFYREKHPENFAHIDENRAFCAKLFADHIKEGS